MSVRQIVPAEILRVGRRVALAAVVFAIAVSPIPASADPDPDCAVSGLDDRCELWTALVDDEDGAAPFNNPVDMAATSDGSLVFLAMKDVNGENPWYAQSRWALSAHNGTTGAELWRVYEGDFTGYPGPSGLEVSPDGTRLFVTGILTPNFGSAESTLVTKALDAATGVELWSTTFDGTPNESTGARDIVVSPDGEEIYLAGATGTQGNYDFMPIAYDATTGKELWTGRYDGPGHGLDSPFDFGLSPDGGTLVMTGRSYGQGEFNIDFGTVAFRTRGQNPGSIRWVARYDRSQGEDTTPEQSEALAISPDGSKVFVGGMSGSFATNEYVFTTIAYDLVTGQQLWVSASRHWEGTDFNAINAMAVAPDSHTVYATGQVTADRELDIGTVAYDAATGQERWAVRDGALNHHVELGKDIVATADGVYVTGLSIQSFGLPLSDPFMDLADQVTLAYAPANGTELWSARLNATPTSVTIGQGMTISGDRLFVFGHTQVNNPDLTEEPPDGLLAAYDLP
jgi:DNA-binding beta-propeller fold protein YncE